METQKTHDRADYIEEDEIDLLELWNAIYKRKKLVLLMAFGLAFLMAIFSLTKDNLYKSEVLLAPVSSGSGGMSGLAAKYGGLASMAGIDLPSGGGGNLTQEALSLLESKRFLYDFINRNNLKPVLFYKNWNSDSNKWLEPLINTAEIKESLFGKKETVTYEGMEVLADNEPSIFDAYSLFTKQILSVSQDKKTEFITLGIEWTNPVQARDWANQLVKEINEKIRREHIQQSQTTITYLRKTLEKVKLIELKEIIFNLIEENTKSMTLAETRQDYIFKIIDPAIVAEKKSSPKRGLMVVIGFILGLMLGIFIALILNWRENKDNLAGGSHDLKPNN